MQKLSLLFALFFGGLYYSNAQGLFGDDIRTVSAPNSNTDLYNISPEQYNHHFEYKLPDDGMLQIDFLRLSDWGTKNILPEIADMAAKQVDQLKDSFRSEQAARMLEMNIPIDSRTLILNYREDDKEKNQLAYKDGTYYQLKTGFDTIRIVKNVAIKTKPLVDSGLVQLQYTFVLKDIRDIRKLDRSLMERLGNLTDSVINERRKAWHRQDATAHNLTLTIDANKGDSLHAYNDRGGFAYGRHIGLYLAFGAIAYNNYISPYTDISVAYFIPTRGKMTGFVGFDINAFGLFSGNARTYGKGVIYTSYNAEFGICKKGSPLMAQKTSFAIGVMTIRDEKSLFNFGLNVGINRFASVGINSATNFKKADKGGRNVYGVNFKFNL